MLGVVTMKEDRHEREVAGRDVVGGYDGSVLGY